MHAEALAPLYLARVVHALHDVAVPPALYVPAEHPVHVWPLTMYPAFACNAVEIVDAPHAVVLVAFWRSTPALQFPPTFFVWLHCVTALQPAPELRVQPDVWAGHPLHDVAVPPADHTAPLHCEQVAFAVLLLAII